MTLTCIDGILRLHLVRRRLRRVAGQLPRKQVQPTSRQRLQRSHEPRRPAVLELLYPRVGQGTIHV